MMTPSPFHRRWPALVAAAVAAVLATGALAQDRGRVVRPGDYIVAVVNQELVTAFELTQRVQLASEAAARGGTRAPGEEELRRQMLDALIEERAIISHARDSGVRIDDAELDRALQALAAQNRLTLEQLRERLRAEGTDFARFRAGVREQMMVERIREREVYQRIRVSDAEIDQWIAAQRAQAANEAELNIAQILVTVPEGANDAVVAERRARAEAALARVRAGEPFEAVARAVSEDGNRERGGEIGLRPANRLPDLFVEAVRPLAAGQVSSAPLRSPAGFHVLKVLERREAAAFRVPQTRVRHILLRTSQQVGAEVAAQRLAAVRREIDSGARRFEDVAREISEDGSSASGGDLGWAAPGMMVPEFEAAMDALDVGGLSQPVVSRFGVHLLQVLERREVAIDDRALREQARSVLRERKFEQAYRDWAGELRARAYVELREPPQ